MAGATAAGAAEGQQAGPRSTPRGQFPDLPDGRPQFGVRVPAQAAEQGPSLKKADSENMPGTAPETGDTVPPAPQDAQDGQPRP